MVFKYHFRLYLFTLVMLGGFALLVYRLWSLQIDRREEFVKMIPGAKRERARVPGPRGEIKDRNGVVLATNNASFEVRVNLAEVVTDYRRVAKIKKTSIPTVEFEVIERGIRRKKPEIDIYTIFEETIASRMRELGVHEDYTVDSLRVHFRSFGGAVPWVYRDNLTFAEFSRIAEHNLGLPGVTVAERASRVYPLKSVACHILGYVRLPDDKRASDEDRKEWDYYVPDDFGGAGVEKSFDKYLRGKPGVRVMQRDQRGRPVGEVFEEYKEPRKGNDVYLTLDVRMQLIADRALRDGKVGRGAVVVIDPASGEILAMVSVPSFDPNKFVPSIQQADWDELLKNKTIPLLNRAVQGHAPGSTFKIPISFAGCLKGIQMQRFNCAGSVTYGNTSMQCWIQRQNGGSHGSLSISDAIMKSCNCFFYQYGNAAGISNITKVGKILGVGERTGVELEDESPGILPNPEWLRANRPAERWSDGYTANTSIGQGMVLASPLQMASVAATVANGGKAWSPHLLKRVMDRNEVVLDNPPSLRGDLSQSVKPEEIEVIRKGMWKVVNDPGGTGKGARITGIEVAGKTGTAQNWRINEKGSRVDDNHTWFISFAPYQSPKLAVCVLVQNGKSGGGCAAPVARRVLEQCLALENGYEVAIEPMPPADGHFNHIPQIQYADAGVPLVPEPDEDGDVGAGASNVEAVDAPAPRVNATPNIKRKADSAGSAGSSSERNVPKAVPVSRPGLFNRGSSQESKPSEPATGGFFRRLFR
ncbi:MAG: penicillin-binding protein 2 [Prosthecobacter sp.]